MHNGPNEHSHSQGMIFDHGKVFFNTAYFWLVAGASGGPANPSSGAIPKAPTSHSPTAKASGDFQFGSLGPDLTKMTAWVPKKDLRNKAADNQLMKKEGNSSSSEKTDVQVQHIPPPRHIRMPSLQTPYQHPHVPHPVHMQPPNVAPPSFQMPMPMALSMGNTPQIQQQVFFQGLSSHPMHQAQGHGFATPMGAQIHPQLGVGASPHTPPMQVMHKAERKYQVRAVAEEAKQRKFKGILDKLTPQNFEKLLEQVKSVNIDNSVTLFGVVSQIFDKAMMEPNFGEMYADLCFHLSGALPGFNWNGEEITFKRFLINICQEEFERGEKEEEEVSRVREEEQTEEEREEKRLNVRRRKLCNIGLIGELYKKRIMPLKIMLVCIQKFLGDDQEDPHEENIEALCKLMSTIGVRIDHHKAKVHIDAYFERMKMLSCKQELSSRVRFMLINAMDLRKNKWQVRMKVEGTKKIEEVHIERNTQANRLSRGPIMDGPQRVQFMNQSAHSAPQLIKPAGPAHVSTPKLESVHAKPGGSLDEVKDGCSNTEKKYSRDFLLKFADMFTSLPEGFDVSPDTATALFFSNIGAFHHKHDSYPTSGKVMDRQWSSGRAAGYGGNVGFQSGQGGNSGVVRKSCMQGLIMSRLMKHVGPIGGGMVGRNAPDGGFLVSDEIKVSAEVEVLQVLDKLATLEDFEKTTKPLSKIEEDSCVFLKEGSTINVSMMDVNGFHVLPSQVESVMRLFERHPDIAVGFNAKNQLLRNSCMNSLLSLIETLCQPLQDLSNEDLVEADSALTYVKDSGFRVDWLEKKLDQVKEKKEKEVSGLAILQETEEKLLELKRKCTELEALAEEKKVELSDTRTPLSFDDVV